MPSVGVMMCVDHTEPDPPPFTLLASPTTPNLYVACRARHTQQIND